MMNEERIEEIRRSLFTAKLDYQHHVIRAKENLEYIKLYVEELKGDVVQDE